MLYSMRCREWLLASDLRLFLQVFNVLSLATEARPARDMRVLGISRGERMSIFLQYFPLHSKGFLLLRLLLYCL